jgi:two-component system, OmpR family, response regulator
VRVLIAEDDDDLARGLAQVLARADFVVDRSGSGDQVDFLVRTEHYDAVVLDLGLPVRDGLSLLREWREAAIAVPVLILTARGRWPDKAAGFSAGADDFVSKPFEPMEVVLRLQALIRRSRGEARVVLQFGEVVVDCGRGEVSERAMPVPLTAQEYKLLVYLALAADRVVSRTELSEHVYERDRDPDSNVLDVLIGRIRRKLDTPLIETVRGRGFRVRRQPA